MSQLGEMVAVAALTGNDKCPFPHDKKPIKPKVNVFPPKDGKESNDAEKLANAMTEEYHFAGLLDITVNNVPEYAKYSAHHLIPGNGTWPKTALKKWVDKRFGHIKENIGYDVNKLENGVSLPGWPGIKYGTFGNSWGSYGFQREYAIEAMKRTNNSEYVDASQRQFHDSHSTYSEFVVKVLDKINEKLDERVKGKKTKGCKNKKCIAYNSGDKKFNPPLGLLNRINGVALRLEGYLADAPSQWQMPLFTSKWGLVHKDEISAKEARKQLSKAGKKLGACWIKAGNF